MKKISKSKGDMLPDYDFSKGVRGKYAKNYAKGSNVVVLDPDVAKLFFTSKMVNRSLRGLAKNLKGGGFLGIAFALFLALTPFHGAKALTADELAHHLGVQYWETTVDLSPGSFSVCLVKISDGKVEQEGTGIGADKHDSTGSHLVIMMSPNRGNPQATIMIGTLSSTNPLSSLSEDFLPLGIALELPKKIKAGDYILGGTWKKKNGVNVATDNIADMESGLLLRVMAN